MVFEEFIDAELLLVIPVLYLIGMALKNTTFIKDEYIPSIIGLSSVLITALYIIANYPIDTFQDILMVIFNCVTQGILCAGAAVFSNQIIKQYIKNKQTKGK